MNAIHKAIQAPPLVSIVVPCFNYGHFLPETLSHLSKQSFLNWECIIVDDGSTDNTPDIAARFSTIDDRFIYVKQENRGLAAARNSGIRIARGKYLQLLDADDLLSPQKLEFQVKFMEMRPDVSVAYTENYYFLSDQPEEKYGSLRLDFNGKMRLTREKWIHQFDKEGHELIQYLIGSNIAPVHCMLTRKSVVDDVGDFDTSYKLLEDWNYWMRAALKNHRFAYVAAEEAYALVRVHGSSMSYGNSGMDIHYFKLIADFEELMLSAGFTKDAFAKTIERKSREIIRKMGLTNTHGLRFMARHIGWKRASLWYIKELNKYRKEQRKEGTAAD